MPAHSMHGLIVILNDNDMSIAPPTGAMSAYLARLVSGRAYRSFRETAKQLAKKLPKFLQEKARLSEEYARVSGPAAQCSRSSVSITSGRSTGIISITCCPC